MKLMKAIAAILVVATTMVAFTSCSKDDNKDSASTTNAPASVADTDWEWYDPEATDVYRMQAEFNGPVLASVIREAMVDGIMDVQAAQCRSRTTTCPLALRSPSTARR